MIARSHWLRWVSTAGAFVAGLAMASGCAAAAHQDLTSAPRSSAEAPVRPEDAIAPELRAGLATRTPAQLDGQWLEQNRRRRAQAMAALTASIPEGVEVRSIPGPAGAPDVTVLILDPHPDRDDEPAFLFMHGGGFVGGSVAQTAPRLPGLARACDCVVISVGYRLAPETPFPGPMEDNFAALSWLHQNAAALGVDPDRIAVGGGSAGGGHAAQLAIAARDRGVPVRFQLLIYPMLDDRTGSTRRVPGHIGHFGWNEASNRFGWSAYLGRPAGSDDPPHGAVPARVEDLSGLPPAWIGVGSADLFFAENLEYARRLGEAGAMVEVVVVPGAYHAFEGDSPDSRATIEFTNSWQNALRRALHPETP
ncbi:alpha/beta hydrolase [Brevundimonas sp. AAP58]|uniref:alpha/beta hydrolase n=1 Tax=Brevundimonas sp. AAP58 TaxID=1523422 RepID=UPI0009EB9727|nr:alpha/beta hydrolase [Brevundimonas sp. AAP58]